MTPEVAQAMAKARVKMRADLIQMLKDEGLTPERITEFLAVMDKAGEELRLATSKDSDE